MCGIYARVSLTGGLAPSHADHAAVRCLAHRGPDDEGTWQGTEAFLGMRRLSVIDLSTGHQPMTNESGSITLVFNGEIFNYRELRETLLAAGHHFVSDSDTEVLVHGYEEWGDELLNRLNGMFGIALWDDRTQTFWAARDRVGVKPLYYFEDGTRLVLASEIKAILAQPDVPREVSETGLLNFLAYGHSVAPQTMFRGIRKLPPGHLMRMSKGTVTIREWWDANPATPTTLSETECVATVRSLLEDSVRLRLIADVPVGAFLSGGLDSSAVVALMSRQMDRPVETFSIGFGGGATFNELPDARRVAVHLGTSHHEMTVAAGELSGVLETLVYHFDEPFGDAAAFPTYLVSRLARAHVTVALTGEGGDELFGGYRRYWAARWVKMLSVVTGLPGGALVAGAAGALPRFRRIKKLIEASSARGAAAQYSSLLRVFTDDMLKRTLDARYAQTAAAYDASTMYERLFARAQGADDANRMMYADLKTWLADTYLEKVDKTSMATSLEARVPLLDYRLVEFAMRIPSRYKIAGGDTKRVLRRAVADLLPATTLKKPKHGFAVPTDPWFRGELRQFAFDVLLDSRATDRGMFRRKEVERLWRDHQDGREVRDQHLWLLMNFELWARRYLDRRDLAV